MDKELTDLLHPRVLARCKKLVEDGHFREALHGACSEVEEAIKERYGKKTPYGAALIDEAFGKGDGILLRMPFPEDKHENGRKFYIHMFKYIRNNVAHGSNDVSKCHCLRMMILASEILDVVRASRRSLSSVGGIDELVNRFFADHQDLCKLMRMLDGYPIIDGVVDELYEEFANAGYSDDQLELLFDVGLCEYDVKTIVDRSSGECIEMGSFVLTELGKNVLKMIDS